MSWIIRIGWKFLVILLGDALFSWVISIIASLQPGTQLSFSGFLQIFCISLPAYLILGIPASYLADWLERFYINKTNTFNRFLIGFGIYLLLGGICGFIFGYFLNRDDLFTSAGYFGYLYLGALASLGFYFAQLLLSKLNPISLK